MERGNEAASQTLFKNANIICGGRDKRLLEMLGQAA